MQIIREVKLQRFIPDPSGSMVTPDGQALAAARPLLLLRPAASTGGSERCKVRAGIPKDVNTPPADSESTTFKSQVKRQVSNNVV
jgi:hypothetical protein